MSGEIVSLRGAPIQVHAQPQQLRAVEAEPLYDLDAERAVLAAVLLSGEDDVDLSRERTHAMVDRIATQVGGSSFHSPACACIWEAMVALRRRGEPIDVRTLAHQLRAVERLNAVGGVQFLGELTETLPTLAHIDAHVRIVAEFAARRRLVEYGRILIAQAQNLTRPLADVRDGAARTIQRLPVPGRVARPLGESIDAERERMDRSRAGIESLSVSTGMSDLDDLLLGGWRVGVHYLVARPRVGKTALALQMSLATAEHVGPVFFLSKEIVRSELLRAAVANLGQIGMDRLQNPKTMTARDESAWVSAAQKLARLPLGVIDDQEPGSPRTVAELGAAVQAFATSLGRPPALVVVDHLLKLKASRRYMDRRAEVEEISDSLRLLSLQLEVPILVLLHVKRMAKERGLWRIPTLEDAAESDAPARDARSVLILHREDFYPTKKYPEDQPPMAGLVDVLAPKVRGAESMRRCRLRFIGALQRWTSVEAEAGLDDQPGRSAHTIDEAEQQVVPF
jgi:replicative DNA helicase